MESIAACWIAIWEGKTLESQHGSTAYVRDDIPRFKPRNGRETGLNTAFSSPKNWHTKKDWRESLNGKRTLCEVWCSDNIKCITLITEYKEDENYSFSGGEVNLWQHARRLTKAEIQEFKDNAPEVED